MYLEVLSTRQMYRPVLGDPLAESVSAVTQLNK